QSGITVAIYVVKTADSTKCENISAYMKSTWNVDKECGNTVYITISANETEYHVSRDPNVYHPSALGAYDVALYIQKEVGHFTGRNV
ncbi:hypothetical protein PMAYCL1PPCAC_09582, partial [Pristionchus mayeri]